MPEKQNHDFFAKSLALLAFALGISLMLLVFFWATKLFNELGLGKELALQNDPSNRTTLTEWGLRWLMRVLLLFALGYIASLIAARGAHLYCLTRSRQEQRGEK